VVPQITARRAPGTYFRYMNRFLLILNVAAAGSIMATKSSSLLAAISPYGNRSEAPRPAATARPDSLPLIVTSFLCPTPPMPATLALAVVP
jgi:hypothetical protein